MKKYMIALDQGTSSCRAIVLDHQGHIVRKAQQEFTQFFPHAGWVEQDAEEIWQVQCQVLREAVQDIPLEEISGIGLANQRETTVVWDRKTGKPVHPAIVWQCRRTSEICNELRKEGCEEEVHAKTGLLIDPYFSATKLMWLLQNVPDLRCKAQQGDVLFGTMDTWLIWNLTAGKRHVTDYSNASRTLMFNIHTLQWDGAMLQSFGIPMAMLPEVRPSSEVYGETFILDKNIPIPVAGAAGDQQAALFGQGCYQKGMAKNTYGTGCFLLENIGDQPIVSGKGLLTTIAWGMGGKVEYALEGSVFTAGSVIQWLRDGLGLITDATETEEMAKSVTDTEGVYFVPAFTGLGTPYWNPDARGMISGLTRGIRKQHLIRAALEAIAYQSSDVLHVMEEQSGFKLSELKVDGGASANHFLMQYQADILGIPVVRSKIRETTALGAAYLAGLAVGFWRSKEQLTAVWQEDQTFTPRMQESERIRKYAGWKQAVGYQI